MAQYPKAVRDKPSFHFPIFSFYHDLMESEHLRKKNFRTFSPNCNADGDEWPCYWRSVCINLFLDFISSVVILLSDLSFEAASSCLHYNKRSLLIKFFYQNHEKSVAAVKEFCLIKQIRRGPMLPFPLSKMYRNLKKLRNRPFFQVEDERKSPFLVSNL